MFKIEVELKPHPMFPHPNIHVWTWLQRHETDLTLSYAVTGPGVDDVRLPPRGVEPYGDRRDGLWKMTCFEAFIGVGDRASYCELNISPSGDWACYLFDRYREGMREGPAVDGPYSDIYVNRTEGGIVVQSTYDLCALPYLFEAGTVWRLGLSAVIVEESGRKTYWALTHPRDMPDFHDPACFALELPPLGTP